jgi:exopolysaccharide production protein ExoQ
VGPYLATLVYAVGIAGLFYLDRDRSLRTSKALWIPVIWLWIVGSRAISVWLNMTPAAGLDVQMDGSPLDRLVFGALLLVGIMVLLGRGQRSIVFAKASWPLLIYLGFCLLSVTWSDFPDVAFKRWLKAIGDLVMVLIVLTDENPTGAFRRVLTRVGFVLLPMSVLLIKYYPDLGRRFDPWFGTAFNTGVTTDKNLLGVTVFVISLGTLWHILTLLRSKDRLDRRRHLLAHGALFFLGMWLLYVANSATSQASFCLGAVLLLATNLRSIRQHPNRVHALVLMMMLFAGITALLGGTAGIARALGRKSDLTGRTQIWAVLMTVAPNPVVGAGFESFWLGPRKAKIWNAFPGNLLNEAHNGYLEAYLNVGAVGLGLILLILISGYRRAVAAFRRAPDLGGIMVSYVVAATAYNITEAGFRMLNPIWIFLLFAVLAASATVRVAQGATAPDFPGRVQPVTKSMVNRTLSSLRERS